MKNLKHILYFVLLALFFVGPNSIFAQSISLTAGKTDYTIADSILVTASIQTGGQQINTVGGQVSFPPSSLNVSDVRFGNSIISLWVDKPTANNTSGTINFTGGVPGGFSGSLGQLFTFTVKPTKEGILTITLRDLHVLLNDGSGGELQGLKIVPLTLNITKATTPAPIPTPVTSPTQTPVEKPTTPKDVTSPESFVPMVSRHESVADNSYFISFFAVDKDSGVDRYEVREVPKIVSVFTDGFSTDWVEAKSPYILHFQSWGSTVEVRAIDGAGNNIVFNSSKPFDSILVFIFVILIVVISVLLTRVFTKRRLYSRRK